MKVVAVFLALVAVSVADICHHVEGGRARATQIKDLAAAGIDSLMGDCYPNDDAFSALLNSPACSELFYQGTCYGLKAAAKYGGVEAVSYRMLGSGVSDVQALGNTACDNVEICYTEIFKAVTACQEADAGFIDGVIERASEMYMAKAQQQIAEYGEQNDNTISGRLINMAMKRFTDVESIKAFIGERVDDDIIADAQQAFDAAKETAAEFCDSGCVDHTARFLKRLFHAMDKGECTNAGVFCGACQSNAETFFKHHEDSIPCCLQDVVEQAIAGAKYAADTYADKAEMAESYLREAFADQPELIAQAEAAKADAMAQFECVSSVYQDNKSECAEEEEEA